MVVGSPSLPSWRTGFFTSQPPLPSRLTVYTGTSTRGNAVFGFLPSTSDLLSLRSLQHLYCLSSSRTWSKDRTLTLLLKRIMWTSSIQSDVSSVTLGSLERRLEPSRPSGGPRYSFHTTSVFLEMKDTRIYLVQSYPGVPAIVTNSHPVVTSSPYVWTVTSGHFRPPNGGVELELQNVRRLIWGDNKKVFSLTTLWLLLIRK